MMLVYVLGTKNTINNTKITHMILDLTPGIVKTSQYEAFKFDGGEIKVKLNMTTLSPLLSDDRRDVIIRTRLNNSDMIIFLLLVIDIIKKDELANSITVEIPYMPYGQDDRDFGKGECTGLKTIAKVLKSTGVTRYSIYDPHSDVGPALMDAKSISNAGFITSVIHSLSTKGINESNLVLLTPDAGAYKKSGKLMEEIGWKGEVAAANKFRALSTGNIEGLLISVDDFQGKNILLIDDICIKGGTFIKLAEKLKEKNCGNLYLAVSHMINQIPNPDLWRHFKAVFTTNSRFDHYDVEDKEAFPLYVYKMM